MKREKTAKACRIWGPLQLRRRMSFWNGKNGTQIREVGKLPRDGGSERKESERKEKRENARNERNAAENGKENGRKARSGNAGKINARVLPEALPISAEERAESSNCV